MSVYIGNRPSINVIETTEYRWDYVNTANPDSNSNPTAANNSWLNTTTGEEFICTDATTDANIWIGSHGTTIDFSDLSARWDFSDAMTLYTDNGITNVTANNDQIYLAKDKTGNGNDMSQTTAADRPLYKTALVNGLSVADFDGTSQYLNGGTSILELGTDNLAIFCVCVGDDTTAMYPVAKSRAAANVGRYALTLATGAGYSSMLYENAAGNQQPTASSTYSSGTNVLLVGTINRSSGACTLRTNGSLTATASFTAESTNYTTGFNFLLGAYNDNLGGLPSSLFSDVRIFEVMIVKQSAAISSTLTDYLEGYLITKWGI